MTAISVVEGKFNRLKTSYEMNVKDKAANGYDASLICSTDGKCIKSIDDFISKTTEFTDNISSINTDGKYNNADNTRDYLIKMKINVTAGVNQFTNYRSRILTASQEVHKEYLSEFQRIDSSCKELTNTITSLIQKAKKADSLCTQYGSQAMMANAFGNTDEAASLQASSDAQGATRDRYVKQLNNAYLPEMDTFINQLKEILDKGLRKV